LDRRDLEVIFAEVEKRPRITTFDEFGPRLPSDRPPIKTPGEMAIERGEPWPPPESLPAGNGEQPIPVGAVAGYPAGQSGYNTGPGYPSNGQPQAVDAAPPPQPPSNWTGGVLPGPLAPLPGWQPGPGAGQGVYPAPVAPVPRGGNGAHGGANGSNGAVGNGGPGSGPYSTGPYSTGPNNTGPSIADPYGAGPQWSGPEGGNGRPPAPQGSHGQPGRLPQDPAPRQRDPNGQDPTDPWAPPRDQRS
jgi:cell division protease FtsH